MPTLTDLTRKIDSLSASIATLTKQKDELLWAGNTEHGYSLARHALGKDKR